MTRLPQWLAQTVAALRVVLAFTLLVGLGYPLALTAAAQLPGLRHQASGSPVRDAAGTVVGSELVGQLFTDGDGNPIPYYFQSRPSTSGDGYDPTATAPSNLGPESIVDTLSDDPDQAKLSLLSQVCARSTAVAALEGVDEGRPYCAPGGTGAVLGVFRSGGLTGTAQRVVSLNQVCPAAPFLPSFEGIRVECAVPGEDYRKAVVTPVRGDAPARPVVPPDAVTGSGSGLDPHISPAYARLQAPRVARERRVDLAVVLELVDEHTTGPALGVLGGPGVNVLQLNLALDRAHPKRES
ncbi:potassium-transporting ATPase subunit C [Catellatospora sp. NPDC049111]|uniref:potassium-transporting ATPase subunit C n=1 Tax=Catellatospora sp. NPDC049111 TaxID=3155271 RepID=UPI00340FD255